MDDGQTAITVVPRRGAGLAPVQVQGKKGTARSEEVRAVIDAIDSAERPKRER
jgi:hypothetical protein